MLNRWPSQHCFCRPKTPAALISPTDSLPTSDQLQLFLVNGGAHTAIGSYAYTLMLPSLLLNKDIGTYYGPLYLCTIGPKCLAQFGIGTTMCSYVAQDLIDAVGETQHMSIQILPPGQHFTVSTLGNKLQTVVECATFNMCLRPTAMFTFSAYVVKTSSMFPLLLLSDEPIQ